MQSSYAELLNNPYTAAGNTQIQRVNKLALKPAGLPSNCWLTSQGDLMDQIVVMPMQWAAVADLNEVEALSEADVECMKEVAAVLQKFGKSERFAVHLVHKHFEVADDEVLCEFTDTGNRVLTTKPVKRIADSPMVETTWLLKQSGNQVMQKCYMACYPVEGAQPPHQFRHSGQSGPG